MSVLVVWAAALAFIFATSAAAPSMLLKGLIETGLPFVMLGLPFLLFAYLNGFNERRLLSDFELNEDALSYRVRDRGKRFVGRIARSDIVAGVTIPGEPELLELRLANGDVAVLELETEQAASLVDALRVNMEQRVTFHLAKRLPYILFHLGCGMPMTTLSLAGIGVVFGLPFIAPIVMLLFVLLAFRTVRRPNGQRVTVGNDGVLFAWGGMPPQHLQPRFVPYATLAALDYDPDHHNGELRVTLQSGGILHMPSGGSMTRPDRVEALLARVRGALARHREQSPRDEPRFARKGRSLDAWRSDLRAIVEPTEAYREARIDLQDAEAILDNPAANDESRIAAALAMMQHDDERARLRIAATANETAAPRLRVALEQIGADASTAELEQEIDACLARASEPERPARNRQAT